MTDHLVAIRESYDTVADSYAELVPPLFAEDVVGRGMLGAFAELVLAGGGGPVADLGCGPGHVTAYLKSLGVNAFGVDLSPRAVEIARRRHPELRFEVGSMTGLSLADGSLAGVLSWWSIQHLPPAELPVVFGEFRRVLAEGGHLLVGFHDGDEHRRPSEAYGHPVSYDTYLLPPEHVAELLGRAGFTVTARLHQAGYKWPAACLLARACRPT
jgi:SAM-dependent methyltransferase